jgi:lysophospholipase L1-like esterase
MATDSWMLPHRDGREMLAPLLESHAPLDWVIIMLGTNDCAPTFHLDVGDIASGATTVLWNIAKSAAGPKAGAPKVLLVSPPHFGKLSPFMSLFFSGAEESCRALAAAYATVAEACGAAFLDAAKIVPPSTVDGVHPDAQGHRLLGEAIAKVIAS